MNSNTVTIGEVRFSYCSLFQAKPPFNNPNGEPKFSVTVLVPKSNTPAKAAMDAAVNAAIEQGVSTRWNGVRPPQPAICIHDGDGPRPSDGQAFGAECKGMWVFTASCKADRPPFIVDANVQPILQQSEIYSGVYGNASVSFFAYSNSGKKGIGCGLNGIKKTRDGEPLGNSVTAQDAFSAIASATPTYGGAMPATPGAQPSYGIAPATPSTQPIYGAVPATPAYPQQATPIAPAGYPIDPITGQPLPNGTPIMGM